MMSESDGSGYTADQCRLAGKPGDSATEYTIISYKESTEKLQHFVHAAHAMLYAKDPTVVFDTYGAVAAVMMQMRFDGFIGFPGGLVDDGENPVEAVNRELQEEIGLDLSEISISEKDHSVSHFNRGKKLVLHFFVKEISYPEFKEIEYAAIRSGDYGTEVLGLIRPPLYTMNDGILGLPTFLTQGFAGNGRDQFIHALKHTKIVPEDYVDKALSVALNFRKNLLDHNT